MHPSLRLVSCMALLAIAGGCIRSYKDFHEPKETTCVNYTDKMKNAKDWSRYIPDLYPGIIGCLRKHPSQPAFAGDVQSQDDGLIKVYMQGADGTIYTCRTDMHSMTPQEILPLPGGFDSKGPAFRPTPAGRPAPNKCLNHERVDSCSGLPLGWLTYFRCNR